MPLKAAKEQFKYRNKMEFSYSSNKWIVDTNNSTEDTSPAFGLHIKKRFDKIVDKMYSLSLKRNTIKQNIHKLKQLQLPEQRSDEWYKIRENLLTASSLADALGKGHFQTRDELLLDKMKYWELGET